MTPQEKAKELVNKFNGYAFYDITDKRAAQLNDELENKRECALIVVEEVIPQIPWGSDNFKFWQQVREEIEKL